MRQVIIPILIAALTLSCQNNKDIPGIEIQEVGNTGIRIAIDSSFSSGEKSAFNQNANGMKVSYLPAQQLIAISNRKTGEIIQELRLENDGWIGFNIDESPILGMGEGGPLVGKDWREQTIEYDRRGRYHKMEPRKQDDAYGSRNPVPLLLSTSGWALYIAAPWVEIDLRDENQGFIIPRNQNDSITAQQNKRNQRLKLGKGIHPPGKFPQSSFDLYLFDTNDPLQFYRDLSLIAKKSVLPPKWALGYMQSHRTLEDERQLLDIANTFRAKELPVDAVIYLGTGFCPQGWNMATPSFKFNPNVFTDDPEEIIEELHRRNVKVILHMLPWDRDKLPTLHGNIPPNPEEELNTGHMLNYWDQHAGLLESGIDGFWPDGGDWFNLDERINRHKLYYQGALYTKPNVRPWSLHRNGYLGIAQWGGWVWSGDVEASWKTLEGQIAVGINHSSSLSPYWGSDIGGFFPNEELTAELYARWFQFGAFCPSFRSHGRTWWTRLPWGWGLSEMGPLEYDENPLESELNNPLIEQVCKKYSELRYKLMPYTYTLTWEAREIGLPLMRSMWIHYPEDKLAGSLGDQYLWGRDILVCPIYEKGTQSRKLYLPDGDWYDWWTSEKHSGGKSIVKKVDLSIMPIYVRAGAIITVDPIRQYVDEEVDEPMRILIYPGSDGSFTLYEDDGVSQEYLDGKANTIIFEWNDENKLMRIKPGALQAEPWSSGRKFKIELISTKMSKLIEYNSRSIEVSFN